MPQVSNVDTEHDTEHRADGEGDKRDAKTKKEYLREARPEPLIKRDALYTLKKAMMTKAKASIHATAVR